MARSSAIKKSQANNPVKKSGRLRKEKQSEAEQLHQHHVVSGRVFKNCPSCEAAV